MNFEATDIPSFCIVDTGDFFYPTGVQTLLTVGVIKGDIIFYIDNIIRTYNSYLHLSGKEIINVF